MKRTFGLLVALLPCSFATAQCELAPLSSPVPGVDKTLIIDFGTSIVASGDLLVVGDQGTIYDSHLSGAVHTYVRTGQGWESTGFLVSPGPESGQLFGHRVAVDGEWLIVGAPGFLPIPDGAPFGGTQEPDGSANFYRLGPGGWEHAQQVLNPNGFPASDFGKTVAIGEGRTLVGRNTESGNIGAVHAYELVDETWELDTILQPVQLDGVGGFGTSLALDPPVALIGAPATESEIGGAVYIFEEVDGAWVQTARFFPDEGDPGQAYGFDVDVAAGTAVVGARLDSEKAPEAGAAYVYERTSKGWQATAKLTAEDGESGDRFGFRVATSGERIVVSAPSQGVGNQYEGQVYLYERGESGWEQALQWSSIEIAPVQHFGTTLELAEDILYVTDDANLTERRIRRFSLDGQVPTELFQDGQEISVGAGGSQALGLHACLENAGAAYLLVGSATGIGPTPLPSGLSLPLTLDEYTQHTVLLPNQPPLVDTFGLLDEEARAVANFELEPGSSPDLIGLRLYHAFLVFDPEAPGTSLVATSPSSRLVLTP